MTLPNGKRICCDCRVPKPATLEHFYRHRAARDGLQSRCKRCDCAHRSRRAKGRPAGGIYERIAAELGVTTVRVQQIEASALKKLRRSGLLREFVQT